MSRSVLLQLARDSIQEVFEAQRTIDKQTLLEKYPLLQEKIPVTVNIYLDEKLRGSHSSDDNSLLENIIRCAKKSSFEDSNFTPLTTSEYLSSEIELLIETPDGAMSEKDPAILKTTHQNSEISPE
jgi:AMMECR1 domain-containing protein